MAQDIFLKIVGIDGESQDASHENEIEVLAWRWAIQQQSSMHSGSGGGAAKASVADLIFDHDVDRASPNLMKYCFTGKHAEQARLTVRKAGGSPLEYLKITMHDVIISAIKSEGAASDETRCRETVSLSFARVTQEYIVQTAQGGSGGAVTAGFDIKRNRET
jgi:type VI secretion system secreted protein Hcp